MNELEKKLKEQIEEAQPLSDKIIKSLPNPFYTSGRKMKFGDKIVMVLIEYKLDGVMSNQLTGVILHETEIKNFSLKYNLEYFRGDYIVVTPK